MSKYRYYAIKSTGGNRVFPSWDECCAFRNQYPHGAQYKGFMSLDEANRFINETPLSSERNVSSNTQSVNCSKETILAFTDGSFDEKKKVWGYGVVIVDPFTNTPLDTFSMYGDAFVSARNVAGEIFGVIKAVEEAIKHGYQKIEIFHDYEGVEAWISGRWRAKQELTLMYQDVMQRFKKEIDISFHKVAAHTGDKFNEMADVLAKRAIGI